MRIYVSMCVHIPSSGLSLHIPNLNPLFSISRSSTNPLDMESSFLGVILVVCTTSRGSEMVRERSLCWRVCKCFVSMCLRHLCMWEGGRREGGREGGRREGREGGRDVRGKERREERGEGGR